MNEDNCLMVGVYIPPTGSPYYKDDTFNIIENEIFQNVESGKPLLLLGDFNARTKFSPDYTTMDDVYNDNIDINNYMNDITNLDNLSIPRDRASQEIGRVNQHGVKLLDLCKLHNMYQWRSKMRKSGGAHRHVIYVPSVKNQYKRVVIGYMVIY